MKPLSQCRLYAFVDTAYLHGRPPEDVTAQLCLGGADIIQLRAKRSSVDEIRRMAELILPITRAAGIPLVINDHFSLAQDLGAEFCHLGQEDFEKFVGAHPVPRQGPQPRIGLSTHTPTQAEHVISSNPAYIAVGPVYATQTKPGAPPVGLEYVRWAADHVQIPWFAIGGINLRKIDHVLAAGARRICVVSAILNSDDIAAACRELKRRIEAYTT